MTYNTIAIMANDSYLNRRLTSAAAQEGKPKPFEEWVADRRWELASTPGWAEAWESAVAAGVETPGEDEGVVTDGMILAAVQPLE